MRATASWASLHPSVRAIPRGSAERDSFPPKEISDTGTITSQFYEDGSVNFSDMPPPVTSETLHVTPQGSHAPSHVTCPASQLPVQPSAQRNCTRTPRNAQRAVPRDAPADFLVSPHAGISTRGRNRTMSRPMADSVAQQSFFGPSGMHYMSASATAGNTYDGRTFGDHDGQTFKDLLHDEHLALQDRMSHPIAFHEEMMGDIMYLNQALNQLDASHFVEAVITEVNGHVDNKHWQLTKRSKVPPNVDVLPSVWSMRQKRDITTNKVKKYKAHLNLHGGKQDYGMNYYETYAPVVTWFSIRLLIVISILHGWALCQCDFIMAYPQAPIECNMYMELTQGIQVAEGDSRDYVLKLLKNIYGQKQAGCVWNEFLVDKLSSLGYKSSLIGDCVFYKDDIIFMVYVDDGIFLGPDDNKLIQAIHDIHNAGLNIEDQGHPADYIGVNIRKAKDGSYKFSQRALIDSIINDVGLDDKRTKPVPAKVAVLLHAH
jgi:hypothetical protein